MDTGDFYDVAAQALKALEDISPFSVGDTKKRSEAIHALRDFIRAADEERAENKDHSHDQKEWRDGR